MWYWRTDGFAFRYQRSFLELTSATPLMMSVTVVGILLEREPDLVVLGVGERVVKVHKGIRERAGGVHPGHHDVIAQGRKECWVRVGIQDAEIAYIRGRPRRRLRPDGQLP